ncbi:ABC transporter [Synechococcus moorigangaii CMS01]|nr:ABC transporter [Synechococcus moorigangaii CMS01]
MSHQIDEENKGDRPTQVNILVQIPKQYQQDPIITQLAVKYNVQVNILAATLGRDSTVSGWFDLQISGPVHAIQDALLYLEDHNIGVYPKNGPETDGW